MKGRNVSIDEEIFSRRRLLTALAGRSISSRRRHDYRQSDPKQNHCLGDNVPIMLSVHFPGQRLVTYMILRLLNTFSSNFVSVKPPARAWLQILDFATNPTVSWSRLPRTVAPARRRSDRGEALDLPLHREFLPPRSRVHRGHEPS